MEIDIGEITIDPFQESRFALDGGAMFGIIPKPLWEQETPGDEKNRITLAANILLVKGSSFNILIEQGMGDRWSEKEISIYNIRKGDGQIAELARRGLKSDEITHVILTHLHFDHCGAATTLNEKGEIALSFPNAKYYVQRAQFEEATNPTERNQTSYKPDRFMSIYKSGQMVFLDGDTEILPGVKTLVTNGHAMGHQVVELDFGDFKGVYTGDLIPTANHINLAWIMGYDLYPVDTLEMKKKLLSRWSAEKRILFFPHETRFFGGASEYNKAKGNYRLKKID